MSKPSVLIINSYAGSLVVAAQAAGHKITGSYEDAGYGLSIQRENFPKLDFRATRAEWPDQKLKDHVVLAHPPCAAFSTQNNSAAKRGVDAEKFQCTIDVLKYSMGHGAEAVCVESVPGALAGAREVHDKLAAEYKYDVYRLLQNAVTFNLAQWRPRFWIIFVRRNRLPKNQLILSHTPAVRRIRDVVAVKGLRTLEPKLLQETTLQVSKFNKVLGKEKTKEVLHGDDYGLAFMVAGRVAGAIEDLDALELKAKYGHPGCGFNSSHMRIVNHEGFASTLLYDAWWWDRQVGLLSVEEYLDIMGFPRTYKFPEKLEHRFREFLSRGVCPPVAQWVLEQVTANLAGRPPRLSAEGPHGKVAILEPGEIADFLMPHKLKDDDRPISFKPPEELKMTKISKAVKASTPKANRPVAVKAKTQPRVAARYRLVKLKGFDPRLFSKDVKTHNAMVAQALRGEKKGLTLNELVAKVVKGGWKTTSPNPRSILAWHLNHLVNELKVVERA